MALKGNVGKYDVTVIYEVAARYAFRVLELEVMPDHVHMSTTSPPDVVPAKLIQTMKSNTATKVFERSSGIKRLLWDGALWERSYFVMSSGTGTTDEMILKYIKEHRDQSAYKHPNLFG